MTGFSAIGDLFKNMSPQEKSALIEGGFKMAGGAISGKAAEDKYNKTTADAREDTATSTANRRLDTANSNVLGGITGRLGQQNADFGNKQGEISSADRLVLQAMGGSPLAFQKDRMKMDLTQQMVGRGSPANLGVHGGPFQGGLQTNFGPSAAAEAPYWNAVATASNGRFAGPGLGGVYGKAGEGVDKQVGDRTAWSGNDWADRWGAHEEESGGYLDKYDAEALSQRGSAQKDLAAAKTEALAKQQEEQKKKGGGLMGFLGKALPIAAMFIPGLGPLASMGLTAGAGALGSKMQGGSWTDAALSGAIGGVTGALRGTTAGPGGPKINPNPAAGAADAWAVNLAKTGNAVPNIRRPA